MRASDLPFASCSNTFLQFLSGMWAALKPSTETVHCTSEVASTYMHVHQFHVWTYVCQLI